MQKSNRINELYHYFAKIKLNSIAENKCSQQDVWLDGDFQLIEMKIAYINKKRIIIIGVENFSLDKTNNVWFKICGKCKTKILKSFNNKFSI